MDKVQMTALSILYLSLSLYRIRSFPPTPSPLLFSKINLVRRGRSLEEIEGRNWEEDHMVLAWEDGRNRGFPGGAVVESLPAGAGDTGSSPGLGRSHMPRSS